MRIPFVLDDSRNDKRLCECDSCPEEQFKSDEWHRFPELIEGGKELPEQEDHEEQQAGKSHCSWNDVRRPSGRYRAVNEGMPDAEHQAYDDWSWIGGDERQRF